jgi:manganese transport system ATP-binding protein
LQPPITTAVFAADLTVARGGRIALRVDRLQVPIGSVAALVGPNGSGKSTLLHTIAGLLAPTSGELAVLGATPAAVRRRVAYVLQSVAVTEHLPITVREVVAMGRFAERGPFRRLRPGDRTLIDAALERLELADLAHRHLGELSGGQRQRTLVAQALAQDAELLLLDEPITGLDLASAERIRSVIDGERRAGRTVIVATHDLAEAQRADLLVLLAGRVVAAGPPARALTRSTLAEAYGGRLLQLDGETVILDDAAHHDPDEPAHDHHSSHPHSTGQSH